MTKKCMEKTRILTEQRWEFNNLMFDWGKKSKIEDRRSKKAKFGNPRFWVEAATERRLKPRLCSPIAGRTGVFIGWDPPSFACSLFLFTYHALELYFYFLQTLDGLSTCFPYHRLLLRISGEIFLDCFYFTFIL